MRHFITILTALVLAATFSFSASAKEHDLSGPLLLGEASYKDIQTQYGPTDDLTLGRAVAGYTFSPGLQVGMGVSGYYLNKFSACVDSADQTGCLMRGEDTSSFWSLTPMFGYNLEMSPGLVGLEFTIMPSFAFSGASGKTLEIGANLYFSLESLTDGSVPVALMAGAKYAAGSFDSDGYSVDFNGVLPSAGVMVQF